jgi:hypothetical protein
MENNGIGLRTSTFLILPATLLGAAGLWFWLAHADRVAVPLGVAVLVLTAILGTVWLSRASATKRFYAAVDAYAEREIDRERRRNRSRRVRGLSTRRGVLASGSVRGR